MKTSNTLCPHCKDLNSVDTNCNLCCGTGFIIPSREEVESIGPDKYDDRYYFNEVDADDEKLERE